MKPTIALTAVFMMCASSVPGPTAAPPLAAGAVAFDVNDVSYLWPVPTTAKDVASLISVDEKTEDGSEVWPAATFKTVLETAKKTTIMGSGGSENTIEFKPFDDAFLKPATWKVVAFRVDPSAPGAHPSLVKVFGSEPQIRIVTQPVTTDAAGKVRVHDFAAHLVFKYVSGTSAVPPFTPDKVAFGEVVNGLQALKVAALAAGVDTAGRLGVHPALKAGVPDFSNRVRAFLRKHVSASRLRATSFMGIDTPEPWIFFAMSPGPDGVMRPAPQEVLGKTHAQMLAVFGAPVMPVPSPKNLGQDRGVSTGVLFAPSIAGKLETPAQPGLTRPLHREIPDLVANPSRAHFFNTDCVSCHTESARRKELNLSAGDGQFRFVPATGISGVDEAHLPQDRWNTRNFGWFQRGSSGPIAPTVTMRTANEAAESADFINHEYLGQPTPVAASRVRLVLASQRTAAQPSTRTKAERPLMPNIVASPLTLVMDIKSPQDHAQLKALIEQLQALPPDKNPIVLALTKLKTVHFARFVFLSERQLAVITTYDGTFDDYIDAFINEIGEIFDKLLVHMRDAPPLPVSNNRDAFLAYVKKHDLPSIGTLYSAYPTLAVQDILTLQKQAGRQ